MEETQKIEERQEDIDKNIDIEVINTLYLTIQQQALSEKNRGEKIEYRAGILFAFIAIIISILAQNLAFDTWYKILISIISIVVSLIETVLLILTIRPRKYHIFDTKKIIPFDISNYMGIDKLKVLEYLIHSELECVNANTIINDKKMKLFTLSLYRMFMQIVMVFTNVIIIHCA